MAVTLDQSRSTPGAPTRPPSWWGAEARWWNADKCRDRFDGERFRRFPAVLTVLWSLPTALAVTWLTWGTGDCKTLPISVARLEVTFSVSRFASLLGAEGGCRAIAIRQLGTRDIVFALTYPFALLAVYLWLERWRRLRVNNEVIPNAARKLEAWQPIVIAAPLFAGAFDVIEDIMLSIAARNPTAIDPLTNGIVIVGSIAASLKWLLLVVWAAGVVAETFQGPRGFVLRQVRFSALAVTLGAVPLLAIAQGQDILQRLAEGLHPFWRVISAVAALTSGALAVWYCARRLVQVDYSRFPRAHPSTAAPDPKDWTEFFSEQVPRIIGIAMLALSGLAFARAGLAPLRYVAAAAGSVALVLFLDWRSRHRPAQPNDATAARGARGDEITSLGDALRAKGFFNQLAGAVAALILSGIIVFTLGDAGQFDGARDAIVALRVAAALLLVVSWLFHLYVRYRRVWLAWRDADRATAYTARYAIHQSRAIQDTAGNETRPWRRRLPWLAAVASGGLLVAFTISAEQFARALSAIWVLAIFTMNAVFIGSLTVYVFNRWRIGLVRFGLGFAFLCSMWNDNHRVRLVDKARLPQRETLNQYVTAWLDSLPARSDGRPTPVILVAAAGGGLRAAYWAAMTLAVVQDTNPQFARHVLAMSGVSGGSVGVATFAALVRDASPSAEAFPCATDAAARAEQPVMSGRYATCVRRFTRDDFLSPVLAKMLAPDFAQRFIPLPVARADRSLGIESGWERSYYDATNHHTMDSGLVSFSRHPTGTVSPLLLLNSTHVETGKRYIASPVMTDNVLDDTRDVVALLRKDIRLSAAMHNSARFTYVSPAGHLDRGDGTELGHVVDGGYFENSGLATLREVYEVVRADAAQHQRNIRVVVLYLCNNPVSCAATAAVDSAVADSVARVHPTLASEIVAPVQTLIDVQDARGALALAEMRRAADTDFVQLNVCGLLTAVGDSVLGDAAAKAKDRVVSPPLGWLLSKFARKRMDESLVLRADRRNDGPCPTANRLEVARLVGLLQ